MKADVTVESPGCAALKQRKAEDWFCIWLVDDDVAWIEHLARLLNMLPGVNCSRCFTSALTLLAELQENSPPNAIVMDLEMPDMNGIETIPAVRRLTSVSTIWMLTTFFDHQRRNEALTAGAAEFFLKRNSSTQLVAAIRAASIQFESRRLTHAHSSR